MRNKVYSMIGLAQRAGKLASGDETCESTIRSKKCFLVVVSEDASDKTKKKYKDLCTYRKIKIMLYGNKEFIGESIGKSPRSIIAIKDINLAREIEKKIIESGGVFIA